MNDLPNELWWRTAREREDAVGFLQRHAAEFDEPAQPAGGFDRRRALALMAASLAVTVGGCEAPNATIVPYVRMPEFVVPGQPLVFATALECCGYAAPVCVESHTGRPTKIEGNPDHPGSGGATDAFSQYEILGLYDPARSKTFRRDGQVVDFAEVSTAMAARRMQLRQRGNGLRILTGAITSPFLADAIGQVLGHFSGARWHRWQTVNADRSRAGSQLAFGQRLEPLLHLDRAKLIVSLDDDFLGPGPRQVRLARDFSKGRQVRKGVQRLTQLVAIEPTMSLTGAAADDRLALPRWRIGVVAAALAHALKAPIAEPSLDARERSFVDAVARKLTAAGADAVIVVGGPQPPEVHALGHWINEHLGAFGRGVELSTPVEADPVDHAQSLSELTRDMANGVVDTLLIVEINPAYDAPADIDFVGTLAKVPLSIRLGLHENETSALTTFHVPAAHRLESWGDLTSSDGVVSLVQPLIAPLYGGLEPHTIFDELTGVPRRSSRDALRDYWQRRAPSADFEDWWRTTLARGLVADTGSKIVAPPPGVTLPSLPPPPSASPGFEIAISVDPAVFDGTYSENAWAQETPRPFSKQVWGNAAHVSPADATLLGISDGDVISVALPTGVGVDLPVIVQPGTADGSIGLSLGYGRKTGVIGKDVGVDIRALRQSDQPWAAFVGVMKAGLRQSLYTTQESHVTAGRDIVRRLSLATFESLPPKTYTAPVSLYSGNPRTESINQWGMVIDQSACIGCNACVAACQAENNIPVVGPQEIARGRDMHWLRVDTYYHGAPAAPAVAFQPVPCMHCEKAPCEPMCPVEASVHDSEGLNVQVYNRCVGTRFCQANCPYKVRRFNFFGYADGQEYANLGEPIAAAARNPDVSVRARGVMEKCTYCVQRISRGRREAEKTDRPLRNGDVVTACQQVCPTRAITFGDLTDTTSGVGRLKAEPHEYALLGELGTRPRTTYLAQVRNGDDDKDGAL